MRFLLRVAVALVVALAYAGVAWANDPALADKLFQEGQQLMEDGKVDEACEKFAASMQADPSGGTALNIGKCAKDKGLRATALQEYRRAAELLGAAGDKEREAFALKTAEELEASVNRLTIEAPAIDGLVVTLDGKPVEQLGTAMLVDPGDFLVEATAPDRKPWSKKVSLTAAGAAETVTIPDLEPVGGDPVPEPVPEGPDEGGMSGLMIGGIVVGAVGVIAVAIGAGLGGVVLSDASDARDDPTLCPNDMCTPEGRAVIDSAEGKALGANILIGVGAAALVGGVVMIILAPSGEESSAQPLIGPGYGGVRVRF